MLNEDKEERLGEKIYQILTEYANLVLFLVENENAKIGDRGIKH